MLVKESDRFTSLAGFAYVLGREINLREGKMDDFLFNWEDLLSSQCIK